MTAPWCALPGGRRRCLKSRRRTHPNWPASPGTLAIVTSTCRSPATDFASAAIMLSRICCAASARASRRSRLRSSRKAGHTPIITMTMIISKERSQKSRALLRSSPRKRGPSKLDSPLRGNERPDPAMLYRLMAWLSPAYPIGAFSYSGGLEWAVEAGDIKDAQTLRQWLAVMLGEGSGFCDAVFFVHAHRASIAKDSAALCAVAELAAALVPSKERLLETT